MPSETSPPSKQSARLWRDRVRFTLFSLLPLLMLIASGEIILRSFGLDRPSSQSRPLPEELLGYIIPDPDLFWALRPNHFSERAGAHGPIEVTTNSLGLRYPELGAKQSDEYRILSLGESSTFGAYVSDDETYSAVLEALLNERLGDRRYQVINAGVSAYSSFQSLMYLELRGIKLAPDMVLFYHELNDYLPSSLRASNNTEIGLGLTDKQLHASHRAGFDRRLMAASAIYRFLSYRLASARLQQILAEHQRVAPGEIGLRQLGALPGVLSNSNGEKTEVQFDHESLPPRVSRLERAEILDELRAFCKSEGIKLVIVHPAYAITRRHNCFQTQFCEANDIPMMEAYQSLHPDNEPPNKLYHDDAHPTPEGHARLAEGLYRFLTEKDLLTSVSE